jgi:hypothetical protein
MKSLTGLNPTTRFYFEMLQASRGSLLRGRISFLGNPVDRQARPIRFWAEWGTQALLLAMPPIALFAFLTLIVFFG